MFRVIRFALIAGLVLTTAACGKNEETGIQLPPSPVARGESPSLQATIDALQAELTSQPQATAVAEALVRPRELTAAQITPTAPGTILQNGETWYAEGWSLTVENFTYKTLGAVRFIVRNHTGRTVVFPGVDGYRIKITSDAGDLLTPCKGLNRAIHRPERDYYRIGQSEIRSGKSLEWEWYISRTRIEDAGLITCYKAEFSAEASSLTLVVEDLGGVITNARWQTEVPRP